MRRLTVGLVAAALLGSSAPAAHAVPAAAPAPGTPTAASTTTSTTAAASTTPTASTTLTSRADVDGDGRRDTIQLNRRRVTADDCTFRLTVTTARGARAIRDVVVPNYGDGTLQPEDVWNGTAAVDGAPGVELSVDRSGKVGDFPWPHLYTWRAGRLVPAPAPGVTSGNPGWSVADHFVLVQGYDVRTVKGSRQITATELKGSFGADRERVTFRGTRVTYRWQRGAWVKVGTQRTGALTDAAAQRFAGWQGVTWRR